MRDSTEDAEVTDLLRDYDRIVARLFDLGVNPYKRCVCPWNVPHTERCPYYEVIEPAPRGET